MRWTAERLAEYRAQRQQPAAVARSAGGTGVAALPGIPAAPRAEKPPRFKLKPYEPMESSVQSECLKLLTMHPRVSSWTRHNGGGAYYPGTDGKPRFVWFNRTERADEVVLDVSGMFVGGRHFEIEFKRAGWRKPSDEREEKQERRIKRVVEDGGFAIFCRSLEELLVFLGPLR